MRLIDTHVHLTYPDYGDIQTVIADAQAVGVDRLIVPGLNLTSSKQSLDLAQAYPSIFAAVGMHPLEKDDLADFKDFATLAQHPKCVAIGEVGTDRNAGPMVDQEKRFRGFLDIALGVHKPVLIHVRETWADTFRILGDYPELKNKAVIHCFTGGEAEGQRIGELGLLLSVTAILARKNISPETLEVVKRWPLEKMMLETDGPYLAWPGEPWPNQPSTVAKIAQFVADLKGVSVDEVATKTTTTAEMFFNLPLV